MDFTKVCATLLQEFANKNIRYAVIGGFALGFWGVTRATIDIDFLLNRDDAEKADEILKQLGYKPTFRSENVARYQSGDSSFGTIDIIYAFREISKKMLERSVEVSISDELKIVSLQPEDIIGLKVQAIANDPDRRDRDIADIRALLKAQQNSQQNPGDGINWDLLEEYFLLFDFKELFERIRADHDAS